MVISKQSSGKVSIDSRELAIFRDGLNEMKEIQDIVFDDKEDVYQQKTNIQLDEIMQETEHRENESSMRKLESNYDVVSESNRLQQAYQHSPEEKKSYMI